MLWERFTCFLTRPFDRQNPIPISYANRLPVVATRGKPKPKAKDSDKKTTSPTYSRRDRDFSSAASTSKLNQSPSRSRSAGTGVPRHPNSDLSVSRHPNSDISVSRHPKSDLSVSRHPKSDLSVSRHPKSDLSVSRHPKSDLSVSRHPKSDLSVSRHPKSDHSGDLLGEAKRLTHHRSHSKATQHSRDSKDGSKSKLGQKGSGSSKPRMPTAGKRKAKPKTLEEVDVPREPRDSVGSAGSKLHTLLYRTSLRRAEPTLIKIEDEKPEEVDDDERESTDGSAEYDTEPEASFDVDQTLSMLETTGRAGYLRACQEVEAAPCSIFMRQAVDDCLHLQSYGLMPHDTRAVARGCRDNHFMTSINLKNNLLGHEGVLYIAQALQENRHISHIDLSHCFLGKDPAGAKAVWTVVDTSWNIHHLNISHNGFSSNDYPWLTRLLLTPSRLYVLEMNGNELGPTGAGPFAEAIAKNGSLEELDLGWNPLMIAGCNAVLHSLARDKKLNKLGLAHAGVNNCCCENLVHLLMHNHFLNTLDIRGHTMGPSSVREVHNAMYKAKSKIQLRM